MNKKFRIVLGSPVDYEKLVAYIVVNGRYIALLNQDLGQENLKVEFLSVTEKNGVDLEIIIEALGEAKRLLVSRR